MRFPTSSALLATLVASFTLSGCDGASRGETATTPSGDSARAVAGTDSTIPRADRNRIRGNESAPIWVIEVSDFQCPYCATWHQQVYDAVKQQLVDSGKVRFAYINYPLPSHRHAWPAAITAMCASAQDRFWPVHDALFATQERWAELADARPFFDSVAVANGASAEQLRACVTSEATRPLIQADMDRAIQAGVNATPSFLVGNGTSWTLMSGVQPISNIQRVIEEERAKQRGAGTPGS